eukprot:gb/GECG01016794.1/.p1 GENE.gb/GECG01016794.1/~~gb/GECG01016794.1/.p1  ORF type:complete len:200 (+),score=29.54 gb/GECG01016794.1/:1-600(+)
MADSSTNGASATSSSSSSTTTASVSHYRVDQDNDASFQISTGKTKNVAPSKAAIMRLQGDMKQLNDDPPAGVSASPASEENLFLWNATIIGPDETPWEGGMFSLRMQFPDQYPVKPPRVRFTCEMFHPNVYPDGTLCLDIIQDEWKPVYTVSTILSSIQSLLTDPNIDSPANVEAARMLKKNPKEYKRRVRRTAAKTVE